MTTEERLVTSGQAAKLVQRPLNTVRYWITKGDLSVVKWDRGKRMFRVSDVLVVAAKMDAVPGMAKVRAAALVRLRNRETMEDLDRLVADRLKDVPDWFHNDARHQREYSNPEPVLVTRLKVARRLGFRASATAKGR